MKTKFGGFSQGDEFAERGVRTKRGKGVPCEAATLVRTVNLAGVFSNGFAAAWVRARCPCNVVYFSATVSRRTL